MPEDAESRLDDVINQLPNKVAKVFIMRYKKYMKYDDIGNEFGCTRIYIHMLIDKGFRKIRYSERLKKTLCNEYECMSERETQIKHMEEEFDVLSMRSYSCLRRANIYSIEDLTSKTKNDLLCLRNMGQKSVKEIEDFLHARNLKLSDEE